jgi:hypothetical protein
MSNCITAELASVSTSSTSSAQLSGCSSASSGLESASSVTFLPQLSYFLFVHEIAHGNLAHFFLATVSEKPMLEHFQLELLIPVDEVGIGNWS